MANIGAIILMVLACAGIIWLQIFLSRGENKWAGRILPGISFLASFVVVFGIVMFTSVTGETVIMENGEIIERTIVTQSDGIATVIVSAVYVFLLSNIPTAILLAIYAACRGGRGKQRALDKMSIQDLE